MLLTAESESAQLILLKTVCRDMEVALNKIVPGSWTRDGTFHHTDEGEDDMPGHVKSSLMGPSLNIPVSCSMLCWQKRVIIHFSTVAHD